MTTAVKGLRADWTVTVKGVDVSARVQAGGTIDHGRPTVFSDFQAPRAVFDMLTYSLPSGVTVGDPVIIHVTVDGTTQLRRFTGTVQALDVGYLTTRVTAVHPVADLALVTSGDTTPAESGLPNGVPYVTGPDIPYNGATGRVRELVARASRPVTVNITGTQGRYVTERPVNMTAEPLLDLLLTLAEDCDATLMGTRLGDIDYRARVWNRPARYTLPPGVVQADTIDMAIERGLIVNAVDVSYGQPDPTTGLQRTVLVQNTPSIQKHGERREIVSTQLANRAGAEGHGGDHIIYRDELWHAPDITLVMSLATVAQVSVIAALDEGYPVRVAPLPAGYPITQLDTDVIGVTDVMHEQDWRIILHLAPGKPAGDEDDGNYVPDGSITGGDETGTYVKNGHVWRWHKFTTPGNLYMDPGTEVVGRLLVQGGGGAGGGPGFSYDGGGGGAGAVYADDGYPFIASASPIAVTPGAGGQYTGAAGAGANGATTKFGTIWAYGGGGGGAADRAGGAGKAGGFGGGRGGDTAAAGAGTYGSLDGGQTTNTTKFLGGPGGAPGAAAGAGGGASLVSDITGVPVTYAVGGLSGQADQGTTPNTSPGGGGNGGGFQQAPGSGSLGPVIVAYRIEGTAPTGTAYNDPATAYNAPTTPYLGG